MRKVFTVLLCVLTFVALVSCSNATEESRATITLSIPSSLRDLTTGTTGDGDLIKDATLTWIYTATPSSSDAKFRYGETTGTVVEMETDNGVFKSKKEITFSRGMWNFTLYALNTTGDSTEKKAYTLNDQTTITGTKVYEGFVNDVLIENSETIQIEVTNMIAGVKGSLVFENVTIELYPFDNSTYIAPNKITIGGTEVEIVDQDADSSATATTDVYLLKRMVK